MNRPSETRSRVITCSGARSAERRLFEEIDRVAATSLEDLARPVRIVVPSRSLRHHLIRAIARERGGVAGIQVQTLFGLAMEVLTGAGVQAPRGDAGFEVVVRRLAAGLPALQSTLGDLVDGYDSIIGAVRDLLDAGFLPGNEDGVIERLDEVSGEVAPERIARARALIRLSAEVLENTEGLEVWRSTQALQLAEDRLHTHGAEALPARVVLVHGFADVTGVAADLVSALMRAHVGVVILDRPLDPADPATEDAGCVFLARLEERLAHLDRERDRCRVDPAHVRFAEAPDIDSEARWIADRIRGTLDSGVEPEQIGVVSRGLEALALPLRRHFRRLGVPFSGIGAGVPGARLRRRLGRLGELLRTGDGTGVDQWIETRGRSSGQTELLLGLRVLGLMRVSDVAALGTDGIPEKGVRLPIAVAEQDENEDAVDTPRVLAAPALEDAAEDAGGLITVFQSWPDVALPDAHQLVVHDVLDAIGWDADSSERRAARACVEALCHELPSDLEVTRSEWLKLVGDRLQRAGEEPLGGDGAGVQVMTAMEARGRTFDHLFVGSVSRGVFPRVVHDDPMLPEAVRARLAADVLPEMPVKGRSADEERYLFAQLISSAPRVELSWHLYGPDGTLTPSPFIDRLRFGGGIGDPEPAPQLWPDGDFGLRPRPAYEIAVLAAPRVEPGEFAKVLGLAMGDDVMGQRSPEPEIGTDELAAARADVLTTVEPPPGAADVEPWFGFCGETGRQVDDPMWVTRAEATGVCPWRAFVQQRLGISPLPDPHLGLPGIDGMLVGQVVHGTLEAIVLDAADGAHGRLEDALEAEPISVPWPSSSRLDELVQRQALRVARNEGLATIGMAPLLEARARRFLEVAHDLEWGESDSLADVLATEVEGSVTIDGLEQPLAFRADRVDLKGSSPVLADYKAAKPMSDAKGEDTRRKHLLDRIGKGRLLQASAYAGSAGRVIGIGRYAYLKPDDRWDEGMRIVAVRGDDDEIREKFETAVRSIAEGRSMGIAFPRVEEADGRKAEHCRYCRVAEACRRDDSGFRRRLVAWMGDRQSSDRRVEETARRLWWLGVDADGEQK